MMLGLILGTVIAIGLFSYAYWQYRQKLKAIATQLNERTQQVTTSQLHEQNLQSELQKVSEQLKQTLEDPVTNLLGWHLFEDRLTQNIKESQRYNFTLGVMFVDIDDFKMINDALGYNLGDELLAEVAERLLGCIRQVDSLTRFTKDTFVILLSQLNKPETAAVVAQRVLQALKIPFVIGGYDLYITVCIGIAIYPNDGDDPQTLLRSADHALHFAKERGKHIYQFYQEAMHAQSQRELVLHNSLARESIFQELILYFQPLMDVKNNRIFALDVRLHWQNPQIGKVGHEDLFQFAEKQKKLNVLTEWMLQTACRQFIQWRKLNYAVEYLGVQISLQQLESTHFIYSLSQIMQEAGFNPQWLLLEIKHIGAHPNLNTLDKAFNMLNYMGVKIALDDFGSESFALAYLADINFHYLKIAASLVEDIPINTKSIGIVKSLMTLAEQLKVQLLVPGVDSELQQKTLEALGIQYLQGDHIGKQMKTEEVPVQFTVS